MTEELRSFLIGTIPLDVMVVAAAVLTVTRGAPDRDRQACTRAAWIALAATGVQCAHFIEEWVTGFNCRFPELLGLAPWSIELWAGFNLVWIGVWLVSLPGVARGLWLALFPIWFLAVASVVNCIAHPLLAIVAGGYFPGLWSSPVTGVSGVFMLRALRGLTRDGRIGAEYRSLGG